MYCFSYGDGISLSEAVAQTCSIRQVLLEILQYSQKNTCARVSIIETLTQVFSCEFFEISKNTFYYRTSPVAASGLLKWR